MDLIERQAAIDAVEHITSSMSVCVNTDECYGMKRMQKRAVIELTNLPSAQPEIIRCKDCRKHNVHSGYKDDCCPLYEWRGMSYGHEHDYQYCSYAERRTDAETEV